MSSHAQLFLLDPQVRLALEEHELLGWLEANVPIERWGDAHAGGFTYLHYAAAYGDEAAMVGLLRAGLSVNVTSEAKLTPAHLAVRAGNVRALRLLLVAGCNVRALSASGASPVEVAVCARQCVTTLLENGVRMRSLVRDKRLRGRVLRMWYVHEYGVLQCRSVVLALLGSKRFRKTSLCAWDRFLVRELALAVWLSRGQVEWRQSFVYVEFFPRPLFWPCTVQ